jgi:four helix bundle protein
VKAKPDSGGDENGDREHHPKQEFRFRLEGYRALSGLDAPKEFVLSKQVLRSGTSIGANVEEALGAQTRKDFTRK